MLGFLFFVFWKDGDPLKNRLSTSRLLTLQLLTKSHTPKTLILLKNHEKLLELFAHTPNKNITFGLQLL